VHCGLPAESEFVSRTALRRLVTVLVLGGGLVFMAGCQRAQTAPGPNIILITIDTLRADRLGAYGNKAGLTPTMMKLALDLPMPEVDARSLGYLQ